MRIRYTPRKDKEEGTKVQGFRVVVAQNTRPLCHETTVYDTAKPTKCNK
jgi:hypothetical protein